MLYPPFTLLALSGQVLLSFPLCRAGHGRLKELRSLAPNTYKWQDWDLSLGPADSKTHAPPTALCWVGTEGWALTEPQGHPCIEGRTEVVGK